MILARCNNCFQLILWFITFKFYMHENVWTTKFLVKLKVEHIGGSWV